jgi:hypothetical protein
MRLAGIRLAAAALVFVVGCATTQPIHNVQNAPLVLPSGKSLTMSDVSKAITQAGTSLGWQMEAAGPGRLAGRLALRSHIAVIDVEHNTKSYSIKYRDSTNLDARDGMIHKAYNVWIENLDKAIRNQMQMVAR